MKTLVVLFVMLMGSSVMAVDETNGSEMPGSPKVKIRTAPRC